MFFWAPGVLARGCSVYGPLAKPPIQKRLGSSATANSSWRIGIKGPGSPPTGISGPGSLSDRMGRSYLDQQFTSFGISLGKRYLDDPGLREISLFKLMLLGDDSTVRRNLEADGALVRLGGIGRSRVLLIPWYPYCSVSLTGLVAAHIDFKAAGSTDIMYARGSAPTTASRNLPPNVYSKFTYTLDYRLPMSSRKMLTV